MAEICDWHVTLWRDRRGVCFCLSQDAGAAVRQPVDRGSSVQFEIADRAFPIGLKRFVQPPLFSQVSDGVLPDRHFQLPEFAR